MTSLAVENDPYILAPPNPNSPVVLSLWISPGNTHPNAQYRDPVWPLAPLIDSPSTELATIYWQGCPDPLLAQVKQTTWTMINGRLRPTYLLTRGSHSRARTSAADIRDTCNEWMRLARWLHARRFSSLTDCTDDMWRAYIAQRWGDGVSRDHAAKVCGKLTDLWAFDQLSARPAGVTRPPWDIEGIDDFLPAANSPARGENSTEPLDPAVLGPLLVWAIRFVDDFADDILAAWAERSRLLAAAEANPAIPEGQAVLAEFLLPNLRSGRGLPAVRMHGRRRLARSYISAVTGASVKQVDHFVARNQLSGLANEHPGPCPLEVQVSGQINGNPWRERMDFDEAASLMRHLGTAAVVICLYLTGMRPQEVQGLRTGCCPDPEPDTQGSASRHLIRSQHYKNVVDDDGNHISAGEARDLPWVAITPVVHAIRVLERMVPNGELLLSASHHDFAFQRGRHGSLKGSGLNKRIEDFVAWVNHEAQAQGLPGQVIPEDPHGAIGMSRFRRSLAWHIARRPGGLVALAIQYGHMRTVLDARVSSGYGSRSRSGMHSVLDVETALAAADTAARLRDRIAAGEKVSGPAARRALTAAATTPRFEGRIVPKTFAKKAAAFLARDGVVLFDNPDAMLICAFKRETALCDPGPGATAPRQYACQSGCGNTVRTDSHARQLRDRADEIDQLAAYSPGPLGKRLRHNADKLRTIADTHDATVRPAEAAA